MKVVSLLEMMKTILELLKLAKKSFQNSLVISEL